MKLTIVSQLEKAIYNVYSCYTPIVIIALIISLKLIELTPTKCLFGSAAKECIFYSLDFNLIYHPLNIINLIFITYNVLYIYYNVILKQNVVGKSVKKIYSRTKKVYLFKNKRKQISVLLFCYVSALILSYFRFSITLSKIIY